MIGVVLVASAAAFATTAPATSPLPSWHLIAALALFAAGAVIWALALKRPWPHSERSAWTNDEAGPGPGRRPDQWWVDDVLADPAEDAFSRSSFVRRTTAVLEGIAGGSSSVVMGLVGPWGSGKSSTLNWILSRLDASRWTVAQTGAWAAGGPDGVVLELLRVVNDSVIVNDERRRRQLVQRIARAASTTLVAAAPATEQIPLLGPALSKVDWKTLLPSSTDTPLFKQIERLRAMAATSPKTTLVVVDDVDRLHPEELLALFRAVRVLGRLPKVHYILVYDESTVLRLLSHTAVAGAAAGGSSDESTRSAADFLEKIVTLPLAQPPVGREHIEGLLAQRLRSAAQEVGGELTTESIKRLDNEVQYFFAELVDTPRAVVRFAAQLHSYLPLLQVGADGEIDVVDFAVLTLIRVRFTSLYAALARDSWALVTRYSAGEEVRRRWASPSDLGPLGVPSEETQQLVHRALRRLFPHGVGVKESPLALVRRMHHENPPHVGDANFTPNYFSLLSPDGDGDGDLAQRAVGDLLSGRSGEAWFALSEAVLAGTPGDGVPARRRESASARRAARLLRAAGRTHAASTLSGTPDGLGMLLSLAAKLPFEAEGTRGNPALNAWMATIVQGVRWSDDPLLLTSVLGRAEDAETRRRLIVLGQHLQENRLPGAQQQELCNQLSDAAWRSALDAVLDTTDAPPRQLMELIDAVMPYRLDAYVRQAVDGEFPTSVLDLAARFRNDRDSGALRDLVRMVGHDAIVANLGRQESAVEVGPGEPLLTSTRHALEELVATRSDEELFLPRGIDVKRNAPLIHLPEPLTRCAPQGMGTPDFGFTLTATFPSQDPEDLTPRNLDEWTRVATAVMGQNEVTNWLTRASPAWNGRADAWTAVTNDPGTTIAWTGIYTDQPGLRVQRPVYVAMQLSRNAPGAPLSPPGLQITIQLGMWLDELDSNRRASDRRHQGEPLPAALSISEAFEALCAGWQWLLQAAQTAQPLLSESELAARVHLDIRSTGQHPWKVVDLRGAVTRRPGASGQELTQQLTVDPLALASLPAHATRLTTLTLRWWLMRRGAQDESNLPW